MLLSATLAMAGVFAVFICDAVIAGCFFGADGVSAVNLVMPTMSFSMFVSEVVGNGAGILYSRYIGKLDKDGADRMYGMGVIVNIAAAVLCAALIFFGEDIYFGVQGAGGRAYELAREYYGFMPLKSALVIIFAYFSYMVYTDGDEKHTNAAYIVQIAANIVFSVILCKKMGIAGVTLGGVIGCGLGMAALTGHFFSKKNTLHFVPYFNMKEMLRVIKFSAVDACSYLCWSFMNYVLIAYISRHYGDDALVTLAVVMSLVEFGVVLDGVGLAIQPLIGTYFGEKNNGMIKRFMKYAFKIAVAEGLAAALVIFAFAPQLTALFGIEGSCAADTAAAARIVALSVVFNAVIALETSYYMLIDRVKTSVMITVLKEGVLAALCPIVFSKLFGQTGLWTGLFAAAPLSLVFSLVFVLFRYGKANFPLLIANRDKDIIVLESGLAKDKAALFSAAVEKALKERGFSEKSVLWGAVFAEEILLAVLEKNRGSKKKLLVEISLIFEKDSVLLIERDSGVIFDPTDPDAQVGSLSGFVLASMMEAHKEKAYQTTTGYNRNIMRLALKIGK